MSSKHASSPPAGGLSLEPPPLAFRFVRPTLPPYIPPLWPYPMSPGDLHGVGVRQSVRDYQEARGDRAAAMRRGVERLEQAGIVTPWEAGLLRDLIAALRQGAPQTVYDLHRRITDEHEGGWAACTISGIAVDSVGNGGADGAAARDIAGADVAGAILGAGLGVAGAVGGAIAASSLAAVMHGSFWGD